MTRAPAKRESLTKRIDEMRETLDQIESLDIETVLSGVPTALKSKLEARRFRTRLSMRRARRILADDLLKTSRDSRGDMLLEGSSELIEALCAFVGAHIHWQNVLRIVQRDEALALNSALGVPARQAALRGRESVDTVLPTVSNGSADLLVDHIRREGALSWACWISTQERAFARRLRVLTPASVSQLVANEIPDDARERERRCSIVELELNAMTEHLEQPDQEVA